MLPCRWKGIGVGIAWLAVVLPGTTAYVPSSVAPPSIAREFRGVWVASVNNIDWPSQRTLSTAAQQAEMRQILDRAVQLRLNAVILQVRPMCDALYPSRLEPWSEYLTGRMGRPPNPSYDPLAVAVAEAHKRGLELHAWFNPYRASHPSAKGPVSPRHIRKTKPHLIKRYGPYQWLNPGEKAVEDYSIQVILDVVRRYDIDGVHMDDYFYPYPLKAASGGLMAFPDYSTWQRYRKAGGKLKLADWRRNNVNRLVLRLSRSIKALKPKVKFGISPFGIWRTGHPAPVKGLSAVDSLYADSRRWLQEGWIDYLAPQLYWSTSAKQQGYGDLLAWWIAQNRLKRHLWPGISLTEPGKSSARAPEEVLRQIGLTRRSKAASGNIIWSVKGLVKNQVGVAGTLAKRAFAQPALVPASPWLDKVPPSQPSFSTRTTSSGQFQFFWRSRDVEQAWLWILQTRNDGRWTTRILPGHTQIILPPPGPMPQVISVRAVDRTGNLSPPTVLQRSLQPK